MIHLHRVPRVVALLVAITAIACASSKSPEDATGAKPTARASRSGDKADTEQQRSEAQRRARMQYELGVDHLQNDRSPQAVAALLEAQRWDASSERTELALAEAYRQQGRLAEAELHLKRALALKPRFHQAALNLAALYIQTERYEEAVPQLESLLDDPTFAGPWRALTNLGWAEYRLGRMDDAYRHLSLAVDYRPQHWPARFNLAILEAERGNRAAAIQHFQQVLEQKPGPLAEAEVRFRLAEQLESSGDRQGARRQLTTASDLQPSGPWSRRSAEYLKTLQ
ncbi:MAG: tetratricopeptide repeat protein [Myxococcota bacterium]|jgi:Tfp pilus assembly protein PilF|nr:tetratricopeptide repeat protein [Myxococcota bacterium]